MYIYVFESVNLANNLYSHNGSSGIIIVTNVLFGIYHTFGMVLRVLKLAIHYIT